MYGKISPLDPSRLGLGGADYYSYNETHPRIQAYKNYMATIATLLNVTVTETENFIRNTIALERRLAQVSKHTRAFTAIVREFCDRFACI